MQLFEPLKQQFSKDNYRASEAQSLAYLIAFGPSVFQTARLMLNMAFSGCWRKAKMD